MQGEPCLPIPCLALVTDRRLCPAGSLVARVKQAVAGGVDLVQLREKNLPARDLLALAQQLREITQGKALLVVNDRVDVALACGADGVQLAEEGLPPPVARRLLGEGLLVGRSVHSVTGAAQAEAQGADFLLVGTVFPSRSHPQGRPAGPALLRQVRGAVRIPLLGIGGITAANVGQVMAAGAQGAAVIQAVLGVQDPAAAAAGLREALLQAWREAQQMAQQRQ